MASAGVRLTIKFNLNMALKTAGWSESYDLGYSTIAEAQINFASIMNFMNLRAYCLGSGVVIVSATLTADPGGVIVIPRPRRAVVATAIPLPYASGSFSYYNTALANFPADYATTVLYYNLQTSPAVLPNYRRSAWIAGIPDAADATDTLNPVGPGAWITAFNQFKTALGNTLVIVGTPTPTIMIRSVDRSGGNPLRNCTGYNLVTGVFTVPAHGFVNNQLIVAEGWRNSIIGGIAPRGQYKVVFVSVDSFALSGATALSAGIALGAFRAVIYVWNSVSGATQTGFSKRNKGRPFGALLGRRRRPRTARA